MTPPPGDPRRSLCFKVDVDTHDGMRDGVPRLLDAFAGADVRATFFLSFGPDNSGKAIWNVFRQKGFLRKMLVTGAPSLYGWRTMVSGTLLPARMIATRFPELVQRIVDEGHEVGVHAWDHRLWQDHLPRLDRARIEDQYRRSFDAFGSLLGQRPRAVAAPAWCVTRTSLEVQDTLGLDYASDMRGGRPGFPRLDGYQSTTVQLPTTQACLEELLGEGLRDLEQGAQRVLAPPPATDALIVPLHAEVEGGVYSDFLEVLLRHTREQGYVVRRMDEVAAELAARPDAPAPFPAVMRELAGRAGVSFQPA
jgi:peptidoglycan/xylan/chitin deacetylase (PgdA/CDA1 family)